MLLAVSAASVAFGPKEVLSNVSFVLDAGDRAGLVGPNGVGKSTLLRVVAGELTPDGGAVSLAPNVTVGYLPQDPPEPPPGTTVEALVADAVGGLRALEAELRELEAAMASAGPGDDLDGVFERYGEVQELFERRGGYDLDWRIDETFAGLGIAWIPRSQPFATLSGGEKSRVLLAALLLRSPDVLLLDEPTAGMSTAETRQTADVLRHLNATGLTIIVIEHDIAFVREVARTVTVLHQGRVFAEGTIDSITANEDVRKIYLGKA